MIETNGIFQTDFEHALSDPSVFESQVKAITSDRAYRAKLAEQGLLNENEIEVFVEKLLADAHWRLEAAYNLILVQGVLKADDFFQTKAQLKAIAGIQYGYLGASARKDNGTNTFRFFKRTPNGRNKTGFERSFITMPQQGYTRASLERCAAHDDELNLAMLLEEKFVRLRQMSKKIKYAIRLLGSIAQTSNPDATSDLKEEA